MEQNKRILEQELKTILKNGILENYIEKEKEERKFYGIEQKEEKRKRIKNIKNLTIPSNEISSDPITCVVSFPLLCLKLPPTVSIKILFN